jgi:hypothetical protein
MASSSNGHRRVAASTSIPKARACPGHPNSPWSRVYWKRVVTNRVVGWSLLLFQERPPSASAGVVMVESRRLGWRHSGAFGHHEKLVGEAGQCLNSRHELGVRALDLIETHRDRLMSPLHGFSHSPTEEVSLDRLFCSKSAAVNGTPTKRH